MSNGVEELGPAPGQARFGAGKNHKETEMQQLSKQEKRLFKRQRKQEELHRNQRVKKLKQIFWIGLGILIIGGGILGLGLFLVNRPPIQESIIISRQGIHWHAELSISILGQKQEISTNIGIGFGGHRPIHTHEADGVIHMEFPGSVKEDDIRLAHFFEIWDKKFSKDCIFDKCNGPEGQVKMFVNDKENFEFENYIMRDGDKIEIIFEL